jgi:sigma-B regulation protein RsbU (phosphoserine phosphatase)
MKRSTEKRTIELEAELISLQQRLAELEVEHGKSLALLSEIEAHKQNLAKLNQSLLTSADIHREDLLMAQDVQRSLLFASPPSALDYDISFYYRPLSGVSGDFYDFYLDEQRLSGLVIADVSGHGIASALYTVLAKPVFHRQFKRYRELTLGQLLTRVNAKLMNQMKIADYYLTATLLRFSGQAMEVASAAHPPIILKQASTGTCRKLATEPGAPLGIASLDKPYESATVSIEAGDTIVLYTDGLVESRNPAKRCYGLESLLRICTAAQGTSQAVMQAIVTDHANFIQGEEILDDITLIVVRKIA